MNDLSLDELDRRAGAAAADLRARADARPRPAAPVAGTVALATRAVPPSQRRLLAVAAALVLLAAGVGLAVRSGGDQDQPPADVIATDPPPYVATDLPDGFSLGGVGDVSQAEASEAGVGSSLGAVDLYGPSAHDPGLGVVVARRFGLDDVAAGKPVDLGRGRTAYAFDGLGLGRRALVVRDGKDSILLTSPTLDRSTLVAVARTATLDGDRASIDTAELPDGWRPLGSAPDSLGLMSPLIIGRGGVAGHYASYVGADPATAGLIVASSPGDDRRVDASRLFLDDGHEVTIRGHRAVVGTSTYGSGKEQGTFASASWMEAPGQVLRVSGSNISEADVVRVAEGVRIAPADEWAELREQTSLGDLDVEEPGKVIGKGHFADGTAWALRLRDSPDGEGGPQPDLRVALQVDSDSSFSGSGSAIGDGSGTVEVFQGTLVKSVGRRNFGAGLLRDDVATVELLDSDGKELATASVVEGAGRRGWVAEFTGDRAVAVARAADGRELGRIDVEGGDVAADASGQGSGGGGTPTTIASPGSAATSGTTVPPTGTTVHG